MSSQDITAWKVFKYGVISGPYFPVSVFISNTGKCGPEITTYVDSFQAVHEPDIIKKSSIDGFFEAGYLISSSVNENFQKYNKAESVGNTEV